MAEEGLTSPRAYLREGMRRHAFAPAWEEARPNELVEALHAPVRQVDAHGLQGTFRPRHAGGSGRRRPSSPRLAEEDPTGRYSSGTQG
jgi:hypothetical protein